MVVGLSRRLARSPVLGRTALCQLLADGLVGKLVSIAGMGQAADASRQRPLRPETDSAGLLDKASTKLDGQSTPCLLSQHRR
jgi:hypothetical protein